MRIQLYPRQNVAFIGTKTVEMDLSHLEADVVEFVVERGQPMRFADLIEPHIEWPEPPGERPTRPMCDLAFRTGPGRCTASSEIVDGRRHNTFDFRTAGDILPWHTHDESNVHTSRVTRGAFRLRTEAGERDVSEPSGVIDWRPGEWHEFTALEDGSQLLNIVKQEVA